LGGVDYNALQAQSQYATANGIDSGMGIQGQRKLLIIKISNARIKHQ
jgi:hypothetical protein